MLKWETEQEKNTDYFIIERNTGAGFVNIGTVTAGGNTSTRSFYDYTDNEAAGLEFQSAQYRLKTMDKDGSYVYSNIVFISFADLVTKLQINPNPVTDGIAKVTISVAAEQQARWKLTDNAGRSVQTGTVQLLKGMNSFSINTSSLSAGIYYLVITSQTMNQQIKFKKF